MGGSSPTTDERFWYPDKNRCLNYFGEKFKGVWTIGVFDFNNNHSTLCFLGYHKKYKLTGFGEITTQNNIYQGYFVNNQPTGVCRILYNKNFEYIGTTKKIREGKGRIRCSKLKSKGQYKGFFKNGEKHGYGEEASSDWFFIGEFHGGIKSFGKYKSIYGNTTITYIGNLNGSDPSGEGILKRKEFNSPVKLHGNNKKNLIKTIIMKGLFNGDRFVEGVQRTQQDNTCENFDISTKRFPDTEVKERMDNIVLNIENKYNNIYDSLYKFSLESIPENFQQDIIKDKITVLYYFIPIIFSNQMAFLSTLGMA